jgi:hypothetical protein
MTIYRRIAPLLNQLYANVIISSYHTMSLLLDLALISIFVVKIISLICVSLYIADN